MGQKCDPLLKEIFKCITLEISPQTHRGISRPNRDPITQVMESRRAVLRSHSESHWNYGKIGHENVSKM